MIPLGVLASARVSSGPSYSFITSSATATGSTTRTFSAVPIGNASTNRNVIVAFHSRGNARVATALTVGGVPASLQVGIADEWVGVQIWTASVPTGTTADVVATLGATSEYDAVGIWVAYGTLTYSTSGTASDGENITLTAPSNCLAIAAKTASNNRATEALGGLSQDYAYGAWASVFGYSGRPAQGSHTVTGSGSTSNNAAIAVDFTLT